MLLLLQLQPAMSAFQGALSRAMTTSDRMHEVNYFFTRTKNDRYEAVQRYTNAED